VKIRVLQNFNCYEAGQVFEDWPAGMCDVLIGRGLIEEVNEIETASVELDVERADVTPRKAPRKVK
jgi:hypothetical protein